MRRVLSLTIILIIMTGCSILEKEPPVITIEPQEIKDKIESQETFIVVIGNLDRCEPCERYMKGALRKLHNEKDYKANYVTVDTIKKQKDMDIMIEILYEDFEENTQSALSVPTTYFVKKGELVNSLQGPIAYEQLVNEYEKYIE